MLAVYKIQQKFGYIYQHRTKPETKKTRELVEITVKKRQVTVYGILYRVKCVYENLCPGTLVSSTVAYNFVLVLTIHLFIHFGKPPQY